MPVAAAADAIVDAAAPALLLDTLPRTVLSGVLERAIAASNPATVVSLAMTCRAMYVAIASADGVWQRQAAQLGWPANQWDTACSSGSNKHICSQPPRSAFALYSARMRARRRVRKQVAAVLNYLPRRAAAAFNRGALPAQLSAAEGRMGVALPWELWELLRHRDGQSPGPGVMLVDDARLLGADELFVERRELLPVTLTPERALTAGLNHNTPAAALLIPEGPQGWEGADCQGSGGPGESGAHSAACTGPDGCSTVSSRGAEGGSSVGSSNLPTAPPPQTTRLATLVVFASNAGGSRMFGVDVGTGEVHVLRGLLTTRRMAASVGAFLERLLA